MSYSIDCWWGNIEAIFSCRGRTLLCDVVFSSGDTFQIRLTVFPKVTHQPEENCSVSEGWANADTHNGKSPVIFWHICCCLTALYKPLLSTGHNLNCDQTGLKNRAPSLNYWDILLPQTALWMISTMIHIFFIDRYLLSIQYMSGAVLLTVDIEISKGGRQKRFFIVTLWSYNRTFKKNISFKDCSEH